MRETEKPTLTAGSHEAVTALLLKIHGNGAGLFGTGLELPILHGAFSGVCEHGIPAKNLYGADTALRGDHDFEFYGTGDVILLGQFGVYRGDLLFDFAAVIGEAWGWRCHTTNEDGRQS
jgi:hypothetical protein